MSETKDSNTHSQTILVRNSLFLSPSRTYGEQYIEPFIRKKYGLLRADNEWYVWGNEIASDIYIPGYPVPEYSKKAALPAGNEATEIVQEIEKLQEEVE